jgi:NAD(P)-dependent dehydrogenase (short-subunit alcohol dehydrogenase family)
MIASSPVLAHSWLASVGTDRVIHSTEARQLGRRPELTRFREEDSKPLSFHATRGGNNQSGGLMLVSHIELLKSRRAPAGKALAPRKATMNAPSYTNALIVGAGSGLSASLARLFAGEGMRVALAARDTGKLAALCEETGASALACDAGDVGQVEKLFSSLDEQLGPPDVVVYNASGRLRAPLADLVQEQVETALRVSAFGAFLVAQQAVRRMLPKGRGAVLFTGASASIKGYAQSAPFAMGKFAMRGLAQSMARELAPKGIHVAHFVIDGAIRNPGRTEPSDNPDSMLDPDAIAQNYLHVLRQPRSAWTWEIELRPWVEKF